MIVDKYKLDPDPIGRGGEATVYAALNTLTQERVAIKSIKLENNLLNADKIAMKVINEYSLLKTVNSPHLVNMHETIRTENHLYIVYKLYATDLQCHMRSCEETPELIIRKWAIEILKGLLDLHFYDLLHRDLKPSNILLTDTSPEANAIITDFGVSLHSENGGVTECVGTWDYLAPEIRNGNSYGSKADIYSYGLILYELMSTHPKSRLYIQSENFKFKERISKGAKDFVKACLTKDPAQRPSAFELSQFFFIKVQKSLMLVLGGGASTFIDTQTICARGESPTFRESIVLESFGAFNIDEESGVLENERRNATLKLLTNGHEELKKPDYDQKGDVRVKEVVKPLGTGAFLMEESKDSQETYGISNQQINSISLGSKKPGHIPRNKQTRLALKTQTTNEEISHILSEDADAIAERKYKAERIYDDLAHYNDILAYSIDIQYLSYFVFWYIKETKLVSIISEISSNPSYFMSGTTSLAYELQKTAEEVISQPPKLMLDQVKLREYWLKLYKKLENTWRQTKGKEFRFYITFFIEIGLHLLPTEALIHESAHKLLSKLYGD